MNPEQREQLNRFLVVSVLALLLSVGVAHAEPIAQMPLSELKGLIVREKVKDTVIKKQGELIGIKDTQLQVTVEYKDKLEGHIEKLDQHIEKLEQIAEKAVEGKERAVNDLRREQRLSRYKSEFVGLAAAAALALVW